MYDRKEPLKVKIESAGEWPEKNRELFIEILAKAIVRYWSIPENREAIRARLAEQSAENHV